MHLEIRTTKGKHYGLLRSSFRDNGKVLHKNHGTISGVPLHTLELIKKALKDEDFVSNSKSSVSKSKEYGASYVFKELAKDLGLDKMIYSKPEQQWVKDSLAMIIGRIVFQGSKLAISSVSNISYLWELNGVIGEVDVDKHCYNSMDKLLLRQQAIQKQLISKHLSNNVMIFYDITSSYLEGEYKDSELVKFGYSRDGKKGYEQICIGLLCNDEGCPVSVEVFPGNTQDAQTVINKVTELKETYGIEDIIFVGDRGMVTASNYDKLIKENNLFTITALTHRQIKDLLKRDVIQLELFDKNKIIEIIDPDDTSKRYCLNYNEANAFRQTSTRRNILTKIGDKLTKLSQSKKRYKNEMLWKMTGKIFAGKGMEKFFNYSISDNVLTWNYNEELIKEAELLDGCYIITTNTASEILDKNEVVKGYKKLRNVEDAFRLLKTVKLEIRPIYHHNDDRIKAHVFICMLSYYLLWHFKKRIESLLKNQKKGKYRKITLDSVIEELKTIRKQKRTIEGVTILEITGIDEHQKKILEILNIKL